MTRRRHTPEQIIRKLREGEKLLGEKFSIEEVCKHLEISEASWHRWQSESPRVRCTPVYLSPAGCPARCA
ncbi:transposase [Nocardia sp. NPDC059228]|uniref:transposase n=1 Tax=Nocardia sp. NPDC059228 TaxID=3346777 RepID=UPI00369566B6